MSLITEIVELIILEQDPEFRVHVEYESDKGNRIDGGSSDCITSRFWDVIDTSTEWAYGDDRYRRLGFIIENDMVYAITHYGETSIRVGDLLNPNTTNIEDIEALVSNARSHAYWKRTFT